MKCSPTGELRHIGAKFSKLRTTSLNPLCKDPPKRTFPVVTSQSLFLIFRAKKTELNSVPQTLKVWNHWDTVSCRQIAVSLVLLSR